MWFYLITWFAVVCLIVICACTPRCSFLGLSFQAYSGLLVQGQRRSFEIGENGGPTLFTESFNRVTQRKLKHTQFSAADISSFFAMIMCICTIRLALSIFFSVVSAASPDQSRSSTLRRPLHAGEFLGHLFRVDRIDEGEVSFGF